jgi:hypothetical protein
MSLLHFVIQLVDRLGHPFRKARLHEVLPGGVARDVHELDRPIEHLAERRGDVGIAERGRAADFVDLVLSARVR